MTFKEEKPIYLQIEDYVCEQILSGKWPQGERLCSVRELAAQVAFRVEVICGLILMNQPDKSAVVFFDNTE